MVNIIKKRWPLKDDWADGVTTFECHSTVMKKLSIETINPKEINPYKQFELESK
jgi:hypothetical protein